MLQLQFSLSKDIDEQKVGSKSQIYKQCEGSMFEYGIVSTITVSESIINKAQSV